MVPCHTKLGWFAAAGPPWTLVTIGALPATAVRGARSHPCTVNGPFCQVRLRAVTTDVDSDSPEGSVVADRFDIRAWPTYVVLDEDDRRAAFDERLKRPIESVDGDRRQRRDDVRARPGLPGVCQPGHAR